MKFTEYLVIRPEALLRQIIRVPPLDQSNVYHTIRFWWHTQVPLPSCGLYSAAASVDFTKVKSRSSSPCTNPSRPQGTLSILLGRRRGMRVWRVLCCIGLIGRRSVTSLLGIGNLHGGH